MTGPFEVSFTESAVRSHTGEPRKRTSELTTTSRMRFVVSSHGRRSSGLISMSGNPYISRVRACPETISYRSGAILMPIFVLPKRPII